MATRTVLQRPEHSNRPSSLVVSLNTRSPSWSAAWTSSRLAVKKCKTSGCFIVPKRSRMSLARLVPAHALGPSPPFGLRMIAIYRGDAGRGASGTWAEHPGTEMTRRAMGLAWMTSTMLQKLGEMHGRCRDARQPIIHQCRRTSLVWRGRTTDPKFGQPRDADHTSPAWTDHGATSKYCCADLNGNRRCRENWHLLSVKASPRQAGPMADIKRMP